MAIKINKKITGYALVNEEEKKEVAALKQEQDAEVVQLTEAMSRPDKLVGNTYKIKTPVTEHALYITINDIVMYEGTDQEQRRPFEIFINSKNMDHFQWIVALTRVMSAVFRKGGDVAFLVEELKSVFEPSGGYFKKGGKFVPSLVAEIGEVVEQHFQEIGLLEAPGLDEHQQKLVDEKKAEFMEKHADSGEGENEAGYPKGAQLCKKCNEKAVILMDGCMTCLSCGDSKCG